MFLTTMHITSFPYICSTILLEECSTQLQYCDIYFLVSIYSSQLIHYFYSISQVPRNDWQFQVSESSVCLSCSAFTLSPSPPKLPAQHSRTCLGQTDRWYWISHLQGKSKSLPTLKLLYDPTLSNLQVRGLLLGFLGGKEDWTERWRIEKAGLAEARSINIRSNSFVQWHSDTAVHAYAMQSPQPQRAIYREFLDSWSQVRQGQCS